MAELDKKSQKSETHLVQSVIEAHEKKNLERVDLLVSNAIKQLKTLRFKPDQSTCYSLAYLARICPKIFQNSVAIKDILKSLVRRDHAVANMKGLSKNENVMLPVLSANILIACCDGPEIRAMILNKLDQWLTTNHKTPEIVQNLLVTICMKCNSTDKQTTATLIDMRQHWLQYLDDNFETYGRVPDELCSSVRGLLNLETNCDSLISYLKFLLKHETDITKLGQELSEFIMKRPMTLKHMIDKSEVGAKLYRMVFTVFNRITTQSKPTEDSFMDQKKISSYENKSKLNSAISVSVIKMKSDSPDGKQEVKPKIESQLVASGEVFIPKLYVTFPGSSKVVEFHKSIVEAILTLLTLKIGEKDCTVEYEKLLNAWFNVNSLATIHQDYGRHKIYNMSDNLRQQLVQSDCDVLVEFALIGSDISQLIRSAQVFGSSSRTIQKILAKLDKSIDMQVFKPESEDLPYFSDLIKYYTSLVK